MAEVTFYEMTPDKTGLVSQVTILIRHDRGEADLSIRLAQPAAGDMRPEQMVRLELEHLRAAIDHILARPEVISRLRENPSG